MILDPMLIALCLEGAFARQNKEYYGTTIPIIFEVNYKPRHTNNQDSISSFLPTISNEPVYQFERQINSFKQLEEGWAGEGSVTIDNSILLRSKEYFKNLSEILDHRIKLRLPDSIVPTPYGTIVIDWENSEKLLSIEIGESESSFFTENIENYNLMADLDLSSLVSHSKNILEKYILS